LAEELKTNNMSNTPFKLRSGNSPLKDKDLEKRLKKGGYKKGGSMKNFFGAVVKDPMILPTVFGRSLKTTAKNIYKKIKAKKGPY
jgi:hypothetical protein